MFSSLRQWFIDIGVLRLNNLLGCRFLFGDANNMYGADCRA